MKHLPLRRALAGLACLWAALIAAPAFAAPVNMSTATTALIATAGAQSLKVNAFALSASGATAAKFVYGTQTTTPCDTGQEPLTGPIALAANGSVSAGDGLGVILMVPPNDQLCIVQTGSVTLGGFVTYSAF